MKILYVLISSIFHTLNKRLNYYKKQIDVQGSLLISKTKVTNLYKSGVERTKSDKTLICALKGSSLSLLWSHLISSQGAMCLRHTHASYCSSHFPVHLDIWVNLNTEIICAIRQCSFPRHVCFSSGFLFIHTVAVLLVFVYNSRSYDCIQL